MLTTLTLTMTYTLKLEGKIEERVETYGPNTVSSALDQRMRIFANLIIDRILEDKRNGALRFQTRG